MTPRTIWVDSYPYDYDDNIVTVAYATEQLALNAGVENPKRCVIVEELPSQWRWFRRRVQLENGQQVDRSGAKDSIVDLFICDPQSAFIGTHVTVEGRPPFRRWVTAECWMPDTQENQQRMDALVADVLSNHQLTVSHYEKWTEEPPERNRLDRYADIPANGDQ